jgi:hypothetical protein
VTELQAGGLQAQVEEISEWGLVDHIACIAHTFLHPVEEGLSKFGVGFAFREMGKGMKNRYR